MDVYKKEFASETCQSFTQRSPFSDRNPANLPFVSQIQELMSLLVHKKSQLRDAKLKQENLVGKSEQQDVRISKIKITLDHEVQKEQLTRSQQDRIQDEIDANKEEIKELTKAIKAIKGQLTDLLEDIIACKKNKADVEAVCAELESLIREKTAENHKLDDQIQNLETLILSSQNDMRSKQDELTQVQIKKSQLCTLLEFLEEKLRQATRAKGCAQARSNQLTQQLSKTEQRIYNMRKEQADVEWSCEQIRTQNCQIDEVNQRLQSDLEGVRKHLATMEKMNQLLQNSLCEYGLTGDKVARLIAAAKVQ